LTATERKHVRDELERRLPFLDFAERITVSALHGTAVGDLLPAVERAYKAATADLSTTELTRELESAVTAHPPPIVRGRRIRLRYAHQGGRNPPVIVIHGNQTERVPEAYRRYLINRRQSLQGTAQQTDAAAATATQAAYEAREEVDLDLQDRGIRTWVQPQNS
jgi:GTP-binding protein